MTEQTNAELIAALRRDAGDYGRHMQALPDCTDCGILSWDQREVRAWEAADALEAVGRRAVKAEGERDLFKREQVRLAARCDQAQNERNEYAAVVDKAGRVLATDHHGSPAEADVLPILATTPADILREHDAKVRAEKETHEGVEVTFYRGESDNVKVIQIDVSDEVGEIRVNLNDGPPIYVGDPEFDDVEDGTIHTAVLTELEVDLGSDSCQFHGIDAWINDYPNDFWDRYAQPMIEQIKADFT